MAAAHPIPADRRFQDLTGKRFARLTVVHYLGKRGAAAYWLCQCDCGKTKEIAGTSLKQGASQSCGCLHKEINSEVHRTHGMNHSPEHKSWIAMRVRCGYDKSPSYERYGAAGIVVCDRWLNSFENFYADMGPKPSETHTIERVDNSRGYEPGNCIWATPSEQAKNRKTTHWITHDGKTLCIKDWAALTGISRRTIHTRLSVGWSTADALTKPIGWCPRRKVVLKLSRK